MNTSAKCPLDGAGVIYVNVCGGLGNQLFQYAVGRALSLKTGRRLVLDISWFDGQSLRKCSLSQYRIHARLMGRIESWRLGLEQGWLRRWCKRGCALARGHTPIDVDLIDESTNGATEFHLQADRVPYLRGYWQDASYFSDHADILRQELQPRVSDHPKTRFLKEMTETQSVAVHIRRTDYLDLEAIYHIYRAGYYQNAIRTIVGQVTNPHFYFFSDDIEWVRKNIRSEFPSTYIDPELENPEIDLWLMSRCRHRILANSSFSWWGAWMAEEMPGVVIAPKCWLRDKPDWNPSLPHWWILDNN
jgi:hypothetical protein